MGYEAVASEWNSRPRHTEPLPDLLAEFLQEAIRAGKLRPGEQLPAEHEFAEQLGVSRATWRAAVQMLSTQGVIERRRGIGTFVADSALLVMQEGLESLISTTDLIRQHGYEPGTGAFHSEIVAAPPRVSEALRLPAGTQVLHLSRTRTANQRPIIQCEEYLPTTILDPEQFPSGEGDWSLYRLLEATGRKVVSAPCAVKAVSATAKLARQLQVPARHPLLLLQQTHLDADHNPILYCENYHDTSLIQFRVLRRG